MINTSYNNKAYYTSSPEVSAEENAVNMLINTAKEYYLYVYINFDINFVLNEYSDTDLETRINYLTLIS